MFQALTEIGQKHGLVGLWRGAMGGLPRVVIGSSTQLCTFSSTKDLLTQWEVLPGGKGWGHLGNVGGGVQAEVGAIGVSANVQCEGVAGGLGGHPLYTLPTALLSLFPRRST